MPGEDVAILREAYAVFNSTRTPAFDLLADDVVWNIGGALRGPDAYRGLEGISRFAGQLESMFDRFSAEPEDYEDLGQGLFLLAVRQRGKAKIGGAEVDGVVYHLCELRDGKVTRLEIHFSRDGALAAKDRPQ